MAGEGDPRLLGVLETVIYHQTDEAEPMLHLYRDLLGLAVVAEWEDGTALRCGAGVVLLFDRAKLAGRGEPIADHVTTGATHVAFLGSPREYDDWKERLGAGGVAITHEQEWAGGRRSFYFRDPAGNLIEITGGDIWPLSSDKEWVIK